MSNKLALITGASSGIGEGFARAYAERGFDLVLVARRRERLEGLAAELKAKCRVDSLVVVADLSDVDAPRSILSAIEAIGRYPDVLVNNAGYNVHGTFGEIPWTEHSRFLRVMLDAPLELMHRVLPGMMARGYGRIINVSSVACIFPAIPSAGLYCGAKSALAKVSWTVNAEIRGSGVNVSAICPGPTETEIFEKSNTQETINKVPKFMWYTPRQMAEIAIRAVERNTPLVIPGFFNRLTATLLDLAPGWVLRAMVNASAAALHNSSSNLQRAA